VDIDGEMLVVAGNRFDMAGTFCRRGVMHTLEKHKLIHFVILSWRN
jgi:hypothetical protein